MTSFAGGFDRLVAPILVTSLACHILMSIVELIPGIDIMLEQQVLSRPTG